ncbi:hypothetical protein [Kribbella sp. NPDC004875]|uniref:hypothetical protein n=1 Tax=Kribbella sp. NPDC004875 TaxID=3364107 RepID=UPI0036C53D4C
MNAPREPQVTARDRIVAMLRTDPADVGCGHFFELLDQYVELVVAGEDAEEYLPGVRAHLEACGPCAEDYRGLLAAVSGQDN